MKKIMLAILLTCVLFFPFVTDSSSKSIEEENKAVVQRHVEEVFNQGNLSVMDEIIHNNYKCILEDGSVLRGKDGFRFLVTFLRNAFPDIHFTIDRIVAQGDWVAVMYTWTGTHRGNFAAIPPTGIRIKMKDAVFYRFKNGKEIEAIPHGNPLSMYQQLGVSPPKK